MMRLGQIGRLCGSARTWDPQKTGLVGAFRYIDIGSIDHHTKTISNVSEIAYADAPSRARQLVQAGDVLVSTVRPNLNAVAVVPTELDGATVSTGFCVLRPTSELIGRYLFHWVQSPGFVRDMTAQATGQSYPAISDRIVRESRIPLPGSVGDQLAIATILDQADALLAKRRQVLPVLGELTQSVFLEMFGDTIGECQSVTVEGLATDRKNSIRTGPFGSQLLHGEFAESGIPVLGIDNAVNNEFRWVKRRFITEEKYQKLTRYRVFPGDVIITIMGTCGRCAVVPEDIGIAINTKHLCCISLDQSKCLPEFLHSYFLMHPIARSYLQRTAKGAIMSGLNMNIIKAMPVALPPLNQQERYVAVVREVQEQKLRQLRYLRELEELFNSLQTRAFHGEL